MIRPAARTPQRVLMTADTVGGVWTYVLELSHQLANRGVQVFLATMGELATSEQRSAARSIHGLTLLETDYKLEWMNDPWRDVEAAGPWLLNLEEQLRPDVVHLNGYVHAALPWESPTLVVAHSCVLSWWQAVKGCAAPSDDWSRYYRDVSRGLHAADLIVAPSQAMLDEIVHHYRQPSGSFPAQRVIYNGCKLSDFRPADKEPTIFSAGRIWDEAKNVQLLQQVAGDVDWPIYVAGEAAVESRLSAPTASVNYLGKLPHNEVASWLARSSIYVLPARYEPFGLSILEAALAGCALVIGDIPSLREIWGSSAVFVPPDRPDLLRREINLLIRTPDWRAELADAGRKRAARYTSERMAEEYLAAYQMLMARGRSASRSKHLVYS